MGNPAFAIDFMGICKRSFPKPAFGLILEKISERIRDDSPLRKINLCKTIGTKGFARTKKDQSN